MVVLNEFVHDTELGQGAPAVRLEEEATLVSVHDWLQEQGALELGFQPLHGRAIYPVAAPAGTVSDSRVGEPPPEI
jgi:hypothetical protein